MWFHELQQGLTPALVPVALLLGLGLAVAVIARIAGDAERLFLVVTLVLAILLVMHLPGLVIP